MSMKLHALGLGLAVTIIFAGGGVQAQSAVVPAEVHVIRDGDIFSISSNVLNAPTAICKFFSGIGIAGVQDESTIFFIGTVEQDGSVTVDRQSLLDVLDLRESLFLFFSTECGGNAGDFGAKAFRARIRRLEQFDTATIHTLYFPCGGVPVA